MMKKALSALILAYSVFIFIGCSQSSGNELESANKVISNYLDALTNKDINELSKYVTSEYFEGFSGEIINELEKNFISAELKESILRESNSKHIIIDANVEVICSEDFIPVGDWQPGRSISTKAFELIKIDDELKINGWGAY